MKTNQLALLLWAILFAATQASKYSIGYELLSQYFAYKMEVRVLGASKTTIASHCAGSGPGNMCTFMEFIKHVSFLTTEVDGTISWDPALNQAGGPHTTDPDVSVVGKNFPTYALPNWKYSHKNVNDMALHQEYATWAGQDRLKNSLTNRLKYIYRSIDAVRKPGAKHVPEGATLIPKDDPDLAKCIDAADKAATMRKVDLDINLYKTMGIIGGYRDPQGISKRIVLVPKRASEEGRNYEMIDYPKTLTASNAISDREQKAFKQLMVDMLKGDPPKLKDGGYDMRLTKPMEEMKAHTNALNGLTNFKNYLGKC